MAHTALPKAAPDTTTDPEWRTRVVTVDRNGQVSMRYADMMRHLGIGRAHKGRPVRLLIDDDVLVAHLGIGTILAEFTIDPTRDYQARKKGPGENRGPTS